MSISNKQSPRIAVVTGASSGIGKATVDILKAMAVTTLSLSRRSSDSAASLRCDVADEQSVERVFKLLMKKFGRIDILVNCAGIASTTSPLHVSCREWEAILRTNLIGTYLCCQQALKSMRKHRSGKIVNVSSSAGRAYSRNASVAYTSSKYGVIGLTRHLAAAFAKDEININCVCPSETKSEMLLQNVSADRLTLLAKAHPMGRLAEPAEVARVIAFLVSDAASYVNGAVVDVNGGLL